MTHTDGRENQARSLRGEQGECGIRFDSNSQEDAQGRGQQARGQRLGADRAHRQGRVTGGEDRVSNRERILGGIARRVADLEDQHLAYVKSHQGRLEQRLKESKEHEREVQGIVAELKEQLEILTTELQKSEEH